MEKTEENMDEHMGNKVRREDEKGSVQAQEEIAGDPEEGTTTPTQGDEEDEMTLEEFGKKRKEQREEEIRDNKKVRVKRKPAGVEDKPAQVRGDKRSTSARRDEGEGNRRLLGPTVVARGMTLCLRRMRLSTRQLRADGLK